MDQLALFRPPDVLLAQLHLHLAHMDLTAARTCLVNYAQSWGDRGLTWEPAFLDFWAVDAPTNDADEGWAFWLKLQGSDFWQRVPLSVQLGFRTRYFQMILAPSGDEAQVRTPGGISKGYMNFLAGRLDSALGLLQREVKTSADDALPHLYLGNTLYLLNDTWAARCRYRDAFLKGLKQDDYPEILDVDLRAFLAEAEATEWAVIEACILGVLPVAHLRSADSAGVFLQRQDWLRSAGSCPPPSPICQFYACLVISESRSVVPEEALMKSRLHMRFLNGRLHRLHMETLDGKGLTADSAMS